MPSPAILPSHKPKTILVSSFTHEFTTKGFDKTTLTVTVNTEGAEYKVTFNKDVLLPHEVRFVSDLEPLFVHMRFCGEDVRRYIERIYTFTK